LERAFRRSNLVADPGFEESFPALLIAGFLMNVGVYILGWVLLGIASFCRRCRASPALRHERLHVRLDGTLGPGETRTIPSQASAYIWNNRSQESAAVYNSAGELISYWGEKRK